MENILESIQDFFASIGEGILKNYAVSFILLIVLFSFLFYFFYKYKKGSILFKLDRLLSGGVRKQLKNYLVLNLILVFIFFTFIFFTEGFSWQATWNIFNYFTDPGCIQNATGANQRIFSAIIALVGMICMNGLLISTITNLINRRVELKEKGLASYSHIRDHYIIIGYSSLTTSLVQALCKYEEQHNKKQRKIVLLTNQKIENISVSMSTELCEEYFNTICFYAGFIDSNAQLQRLNIASAKEIFLLGEEGDLGQDLKNIEALKEISDLRGESSLLKVNVKFEDIMSYINMQRLTLPENYVGCEKPSKPDESNEIVPNIYFRPFNFYDNWARKLWGYKDLEGENKKGEKVYDQLDYETVEGDKYVHLVIVGFNNMGKALLLEALRVCHYINFIEQNKDKELSVEEQHKTRITVFDPQIESIYPSFKAPFPALDKISDIELVFKPYSVEHDEARAIVSDIAKDEKALLTIAICVNDPNYSLSLGLNLPEPVYYNSKGKDEKGKDKKDYTTNSRVLIRQELKRGLGGILDEDKYKYKNVSVFGMRNYILDLNLQNDVIPMLINADYEFRDKGGFVKELYSNFVSNKLELVKESLFKARDGWDKLEEIMRWSNRYQMDLYPTIFKYLKKEIPNASELEWNELLKKIKENSYNEAMLCKLSQMEHLRWSAEKILSGFRQMNEGEGGKNNAFRIHDILIPYCKLPKDEEKQIEKNESVIKNIIYLIEIHKRLEDSDLANDIIN